MSDRVDYTTADYGFEGEMETFGSHLADEFALQQGNVESLDDGVAAIDDALHGVGIISGCNLSAGSGLNVKVANGTYLVTGRMGEIADLAGFVTCGLTAGVENYIFLDLAGTPVAYPNTKPVPNPTGTWYAGSALAGADSCLSVDMTGRDEVANIAGLTGRVETLEGEVTTLQTDVGLLESGGPIDTVRWGALQKTVSDPTTVEQAVDAKDAALQTALEAEIAAISGGSTAATLFTPWNVDADAHFQHLCHYIRRVDAFGWQRVPGAIIIDGVCGEGSNSSPDYIDHVNSTW